jgi:subtilisin family serine protease
MRLVCRCTSWWAGWPSVTARHGAADARPNAVHDIHTPFHRRKGAAGLKLGHIAGFAHFDTLLPMSAFQTPPRSHARVSTCLRPTLVATAGISLAALLGCSSVVTGPTATGPTATGPITTPMVATPKTKTVVTKADQLPRRVYDLPRLPSELLEGPLADLLPLAATLEKDINADLAAFDIQDSATLRGMHQARMSIAMLRGDRAAQSAASAQVRNLQDKPAGKLTSGVMGELAAQVRAEGGDASTQATRMQALVTQRFGAMPWADVQVPIKGMKGQFEVSSPTLVVGSVRAGMDPAARNANMKMDAGAVAALIGARAQMDQLLPLRQAIVAGLTTVIDGQAKAEAKPDIWTPRQFALPASAKAQPVVVAIWDSGVDLALFKASPARGLAFAADGKPSPDLLRPLGDAKERWPQIRSLVKGSMDLRAALDTEDARKLKATASGLKAEQVKPFQEDMSLASLYTHGTHVAGIAVEGNPFASVYAVSMLWDHRMEPTKPSEALSRATAANYASAVAGMKAAGVRVVNMSWRYGPSAYEDAMAYHGMGKDAEDRKRQAAALFAIERDALRGAIASAPEILFVAGSGNEDNSADFQDYIPAGLTLPNLITAGAVDKAGDETSFSTFGKTVVVHANGFEVESVIPGGDKVKFSGTSMAAPQVSNLAAKLFALNPKLSAVQAKKLILDNADKRGRVNLIDPQRTIKATAATGPSGS